jgi:hypothetical protein
MANALMTLMMTSAVYFNCRVSTRDGQEVRMKDAIRHVFMSPVWAEKQQTARRLYSQLTAEGFDSFWRELNVALDPEGEERAYKVCICVSISHYPRDGRMDQRVVSSLKSEYFFRVGSTIFD